MAFFAASEPVDFVVSSTTEHEALLTWYIFYFLFEYVGNYTCFIQYLFRFRPELGTNCIDAYSISYQNCDDETDRGETTVDSSFISYVQGEIG